MMDKKILRAALIEATEFITALMDCGYGEAGALLASDGEALEAKLIATLERTGD